MIRRWRERRQTRRDDAVIDSLAAGDRYVEEIVARTDLSAEGVEHALAGLCSAGVVEYRLDVKFRRSWFRLVAAQRMDDVTSAIMTWTEST